MAMASGSRPMLWRVLIGCLLIGCLHTTFVARAEEVAAEDSAVAAPDAGAAEEAPAETVPAETAPAEKAPPAEAPPLPLGEAVAKGMLMLKVTDNFRRKKEEGKEGIKNGDVQEAYKHYQEAFLLMTRALEADAEWDFKDEKESDDHHREKLIFNIVKSLERKGAPTQGAHPRARGPSMHRIPDGRPDRAPPGHRAHAGEIDMSIGNQRAAKEAYKSMQQLLFSLSPIRKHKYDTALGEAQLKAAELVQENLDKGYFDSRT